MTYSHYQHVKTTYYFTTFTDVYIIKYIPFL